ncbi:MULTISPECIES: endonuclease VII domain-containing protein [Stutzerimonas stutzeri group]|uniref:endonuclease VII domain-containing protein n=1 Tax=Stutzerimonas stutzeri group TaxID=136846 RepID=UPI00190A571D|nr:endonuclease VII domain-containing protein [Stutzerimonas frequens]
MSELPGLKRCTKCGEEKPITEYFRRSPKAGGGREAFCKRCKSLTYKREYRWNKLKERYGITKDQYEAMFDQQGGVCAICKTHPDKGVLHVDHCHATGAVRGLLCPSCNKALGLLRDSREALSRAIAYLTGGFNVAAH